MRNLRLKDGEVRFVDTNEEFDLTSWTLDDWSAYLIINENKQSLVKMLVVDFSEWYLQENDAGERREEPAAYQQLMHQREGKIFVKTSPSEIST